MNGDINKIAKHYGYEPQSRQLIEEMSELSVAINKHWRKQLNCGRTPLEEVSFGTPEEQSIIEEIADVEIMLEQMKIFFVCHKEVEKCKEQKIKRQLERMKRHE